MTVLKKLMGSFSSYSVIDKVNSEHSNFNKVQILVVSVSNRAPRSTLYFLIYHTVLFKIKLCITLHIKCLTNHKQIYYRN